MKTNIKFPELPYRSREYFVQTRCSYLCDNEVQKAVIEGRFVLAWGGKLGSEDNTLTLGVLEGVRMNSDGSRTYTVTTEHGTERLDYGNAVLMKEDCCPEVVLTGQFGQHFIRRWIGLQERTDGKVYAIITDGNTSSMDVDPSTLILLDDCKVGLPEREEKF